MARKRRASSSSRAKGERDAEAPPARGERLQKVLAAAGVGSRRDCEELITDGRVEVDGEVITELGVRVDPHAQEIRVDGSRLATPKRLYYVVNKPVGIVCTNFDPSGRMRVVDLVDTDERLFSIGRLDRSSEGMILLTNDGEFANRIAHPRYGVDKTYRVVVAGQPQPEDLQKLIRGVYLSDGVARATSVSVRKKHRESTELEIVLNEGKNREIRRVLARIGHKVLRLKRTAIGDLKLGELPTGAARRLTAHEVRSLELQSQGRSSRPGRGKGAASARNVDQPQTRKPRAGSAAPQPPQTYGAVLDFEAPASGAERPEQRERPRRGAAGGKSAGRGATARGTTGRGAASGGAAGRGTGRPARPGKKGSGPRPKRGRSGGSQG